MCILLVGYIKSLNIIIEYVEDIFRPFIIFLFIVSCLHKHLGTV